jgi:hypothetical protein
MAEQPSYLEHLFDLSSWPILVLFLIILIIQCMTFRKVHPRYFDTSALVFLAMITLCLASKTIIIFLKAMNQHDTENNIKFPFIDVLNMVTDLAYWVLLNFFILEMKTVRDIVSAKDNEEFEKNFKVTIILRRYVLSVLAVAGLVFRVGVSCRLFGWEPRSDGAREGYEIV